jgi:hypothetical protein
MNYFVLGFSETNLIRIERVDFLNNEHIEEVVYGIFDIPFATPLPTIEEAMVLKQELINNDDVWWHSGSLIDIYSIPEDKNELKIFEIGFVK